jgi:hypothetical protein
MQALALTGSTFDDAAVCPGWAALFVVLQFFFVKLATSLKVK